MDALALPQQAGPHRLANLGLLIVGFGVGQGSIFLAQSWLVRNGQLDALAQFGIAFSFAMLGIQLVDAGALTLLAKRAAQFAAGVASRVELERGYWAHTYVRLVLAAAAVGVAAVLLAAFPDRHALAYLFGAWPGLVLWSFNGSGILDGLNRGGLSGLTGAIPYLTSAVALPLSVEWSGAEAGLVQGLVFSAGNLATVAVQLVLLRSLGLRLRPVLSTGTELKTTLREGAAMLLGALSGQLFFRLQLLISTSVLGKPATAIFIYAYQIISAAVQVIGFVRRVEFPALVSRFARRDISVRAILRQQTLGTALSLLLTLCFLAVGLVGSVVPAEWKEPAELLVPLSFVVAASGVTFALSQGAHASGRHGCVAMANTIGAAAGTAVTLALAQGLQLAGLALGNLACLCATAGALVLLFSAEASHA